MYKDRESALNVRYIIRDGTDVSSNRMGVVVVEVTLTAVRDSVSLCK